MNHAPRPCVPPNAGCLKVVCGCGFRFVAVGLVLGLRVPFLNGTAGSKFIVRPMTATLIRKGVAMDLQFIKNRRLIVRKRSPQPHTVWKSTEE